MRKEMWLIWKQPETRRRYKVGILIYNDESYTFKYDREELNDAIAVGFHFFPGFDNLNEAYTSKELFTNIETRLPNVTRVDYLDILNRYNLEKSCTKWDILRATRGRLLTDNYEFVLAFDKEKIEFDIAGTRYCHDITKCQDIINIKDKLILEPDNNNQYDDKAVKIICNKEGNNYHLGYVPRYYSKDIAQLLNNQVGYSAIIQNISFEKEFNDEDITILVRVIFDNN